MTIAFTKVSLPFGWLGNMAPFPVEFEGQRWRTTEALFQALRFDDADIREEIRGMTSPMSAKMVAKRHAERMVVEPRSAQDVENMRRVLCLKLDQHPALFPNWSPLETRRSSRTRPGVPVSRPGSGGRHSWMKNGLGRTSWEDCGWS